MENKDKIRGGFYIKARSIQNSTIAKAPPYIREIWDYILKEANYKDRKVGGVVVKRGQLFKSYKEIREALSWKVGYRKMQYNENHTKRAMKALRAHLMIDTTKKLGGLLITVLNYDKYQNPDNYERTNERTDERPNERTNGEPMVNQQVVQERKEREESNNPPTPQGGDEAVKKKLISWLSTMQSVGNPTALADFYFRTFVPNSIEKALKNSSCVSRSKFSELCNYYQNLNKPTHV